MIHQDLKPSNVILHPARGILHPACGILATT